MNFVLRIKKFFTDNKQLVSIVVIMLISISCYSQSKENIGSGINSQFRDINPIVSADGQTIYFSRVDHPKNNYGSDNSEDCWVSSYNKYKDEWEISVRLPYSFNSQQINSVLSVTPDGNVFLIRGAYEDGVLKGKGLSLIYREKDGYSLPNQLNIKYYRKIDKGIYSGGFLTNDGRTLILYLGIEKNSEVCDLYFSHLKDNGTWTKPKGLGKNINTREFDEISPFMAADGKTLYFSSDREGGFGLHDIYMSKRLDKSWTNWSEPVNLGDKVNSENWEAYYSISASGDYAFMTSTENSIGKEDIVRIPLSEDIKPDVVVIISGKVIDGNTGKPLSTDIFYEKLPAGITEGNARTNPGDGSYKIVLPAGFQYGFTAKLNGYFPVSDYIDLTNVTEYQEISRNIEILPLEVGHTVVLNNIFFDFNEIVLRSESYPELKRVIKLMKENPDMEIEISGHTDNVGADDFNNNLSKGRARAVAWYLIDNGIDVGRIRSVGYGKSKPIADNETEEGKQLNRRVEFTILKK